MGGMLPPRDSGEDVRPGTTGADAASLQLPFAKEARFAEVAEGLSALVHNDVEGALTLPLSADVAGGFPDLALADVDGALTSAGGVAEDAETSPLLALTNAGAADVDALVLAEAEGPCDPCGGACPRTTYRCRWRRPER
jgi:hypothetical protein